jgi:hypothetical protein
LINLDKYTSSLVEKDGISFSKKESEISYPKSANEDFFEIEENSFWFKHRNNCIIEAVKKHSPDQHFFDIGGGNGYVAKGLEENGITSILVEPGIQGCLNAKKRNLQNIVCSTLENASFTENSIPSVGLFDVVEHIEDDGGFLKSIHRILMKGGFVFITVPAYQLLWSNDDVYAEHHRRYSLKNLEKKLCETGFAITYSTYIFSLLPLPVLFFRTIPSRLGFNKNSGDVDKHKNEHKANEGFINKLLDKIWALELNQIRSGKKIPFGGSCFVVARKMNN